MTETQINNIFTYHAPDENQKIRYEKIRREAKSLARVFQDSCPESHEKRLAITALHQAIMWANASIAINELVSTQSN